MACNDASVDKLNPACFREYTDTEHVPKLHVWHISSTKLLE